MPPQPSSTAVEIKVNVAIEHAEAALRALGLAEADGKQRRIWFYEHVIGIEGPAALPLFHRSVIIRVRRKPTRQEGDITVKLRGAELELPDEWSTARRGPTWAFKIEGDWTGDRRTTSASLSADFDDDQPPARRAPRLSDLTIPRQVDLLHRAIAVPIDIGALRPLGPINARAWRPTDVGFTEKVAAEHWRAGSLQFLELSVRVEADAEAAQRNFDAFLTARGVQVAAVTETKTELVLRHFADRGSRTASRIG